MNNIINYLSNSLKRGVNYLSSAGLSHQSEGLHQVESRLRGALQFLKKTAIKAHGKKFKLNLLPWYLLIGASGSGKTTMLAHSGVNYVLNKKIKLEHLAAIPSSESCDWWVTSDLVLVDVPGKYLGGQANQAVYEKTWNYFLTLVCKLRGKKGINGIVVALSLADLLDTDILQRDAMIINLKNQIKKLRQQFHEELPIYFVLTKADLVPGFLEYFGNFSSDELAQAWGITLPPAKPLESLRDLFTERFNALIKRLNTQLILHLHQERNAYARSFIKDFPLQVERIKEVFADVLVQLIGEDKPFNLRGVYLTSTMQPSIAHESNAYSPLALNHFYQQSLAIMSNPSMPPQAYFIKQFLMQALSTEKPFLNAKKHLAQYAAGVALGLALISGFYAKSWFIGKENLLASNDYLARGRGVALAEVREQTVSPSNQF